MNIEPPTVFISYSHRDEEWKNKLVKQLEVLAGEGYFKIWEDCVIDPGEEWNAEIESAIEHASVAIFLISADFLTSKFIRSKEVPPLLERKARAGVRIIPILLKDCVWEGVEWLSKLQMRPQDGRPIAAGTTTEVDRDLANISRELLELLDNASSDASPERDAASDLETEDIVFDRTSQMTPMAPRLSNRYSLIDKLWCGPRNEVFKAWDYERSIDVAIKRPVPGAGQEGVERLKREARLGKRAEHPYVCPVIASRIVGGDESIGVFARLVPIFQRFIHRDVSEPIGQELGSNDEALQVVAENTPAYIIIPYLEGELLSKRRAKLGFFPINDAIKLLENLCEGLHHLHTKNIVFWDVKPENVMLVIKEDGVEVTIIFDFDLAIELDERREGERLTQNGFVVGTPAFLSPEQISDNEIDCRTDIYQLGIVAYEMLTGHLSFEHVPEKEKPFARMRGGPLPLRHYQSSISIELEQVVLKALEANPDNRYTSMMEFRDALIDSRVS